MQKDRCLKTGGGGRGSQENLCKMLSARAAVARAARGRLWNHGRRYFNRQLRAAGEALRLPLVRTLRHEQSRLSGLRRRVDGRKVVEDGAETAQGHRRAGVDDLAPQHLSGSIAAARAEAKLRSKNKNASTRDRGVGARGNFYQVTVGLRQNCGAPRGVRTGGHGLAINWFLSTDLENTRRILDAHEEVCVCFGRVAAVPAQLQTAGYYPSSSFIFTRVVSRRARAV